MLPAKCRCHQRWSTLHAIQSEIIIIVIVIIVRFVSYNNREKLRFLELVQCTRMCTVQTKRS